MEYEIDVIDLIEFLKSSMNMCHAFLNAAKPVIALNVKIKWHLEISHPPLAMHYHWFLHFPN